MQPRPTDDPILNRFLTALNAVYGDRIERVVLFGSRARGDARSESDYVVAVFLRQMTDRWQQMHRLRDIESDMLYATGASVQAMPYDDGFWRERTTLMHEIRRDGIDLKPSTRLCVADRFVATMDTAIRDPA